MAKPLQIEWIDNIPYCRKGLISVKNLTKEQKKAQKAFSLQFQRCNNPNNNRYRSYGAKGIKVEYTKHEFIVWYQQNIKNFVGKNPSIGRINHSKNYSLDNIEIQSISENSKERHKRNPNKHPAHNAKKVGLFSKKNNELLIIFSSGLKCAKSLGITKDSVWKQCVGKIKNGSRFYPWYYRYI